MLQYRPNRRYDKENYSLNTNYFLQFKCKNNFLPFSVSVKRSSAVVCGRLPHRGLKINRENFNPPPNEITGPPSKPLFYN